MRFCTEESSSQVILTVLTGRMSVKEEELSEPMFSLLESDRAHMGRLDGGGENSRGPGSAGWALALEALLAAMESPNLGSRKMMMQINLPSSL